MKNSVANPLDLGKLEGSGVLDTVERVEYDVYSSHVLGHFGATTCAGAVRASTKV